MMNGVFTQSLSQWMNSLSVDRVLMLFMAIFALIGAIDQICGNRHGYGAAFTEGLCMMGSLAQTVAAVFAAAPLLARLLTPVFTPFLHKFHADACALAGVLLPSDMGGYALAMEMADSPAIGNFSGLILGGTVGSIWVFTLPVALSILTERDRPLFASGILCGLITIPFGCLTGGFLMNFTDFALPFQTILLHTLPVAGLALLVGAGLWLQPNRTIQLFSYFGKAITVIGTLLTVIAIFEQLTGILLPFFDIMTKKNTAGLTGFEEGLLLCGKIALVLSGAFPMVLWMKKHGTPLLGKIEQLLGINSVASLGLLAVCANCIPAFTAMKDMDDRGKIITAAFAAGGGFALGDYLGFAAGAEPQMILPMLGAKFISGILGVLLASVLSPILISRSIRNVPTNTNLKG